MKVLVNGELKNSPQLWPGPQVPGFLHLTLFRLVYFYFKTEVHSCAKLVFLSVFIHLFVLLLLSFSIHHSPDLHPLASVASFSLSPERRES